jgi:hypothetical protein
MVFGLTRSGLEPTIYRTREHTNHYTTNAGTFAKRMILLQHVYNQIVDNSNTTVPLVD